MSTDEIVTSPIPVDDDARADHRTRLAWRTCAVVAVVLAAGPAWQAWRTDEPARPAARPTPAAPVALEPGDPAPVAPEGETLWVDPEDEDAFARVAGLILDDFEDWGTADGRPHIQLIARSGWRVGAAMLDYARRANDGALGQ